mmetsp:Transcript_16388/g.37786  ORF Transcript_16388/g.37786 Transcript_16388/m.37786 type:complete len:227 (+) Transcript_16388:1399-2079(+)
MSTSFMRSSYAHFPCSQCTVLHTRGCFVDLLVTNTTSPKDPCPSIVPMMYFSRMSPTISLMKSSRWVMRFTGRWRSRTLRSKLGNATRKSVFDNGHSGMPLRPFAALARTRQRHKAASANSESVTCSPHVHLKCSCMALNSSCSIQSACANLSNKLLAMLRVASMLRKATPRCERMRSCCFSLAWNRPGCDDRSSPGASCIHAPLAAVLDTGIPFVEQNRLTIDSM